MKKVYFFIFFILFSFFLIFFVIYINKYMNQSIILEHILNNPKYKEYDDYELQDFFKNMHFNNKDLKNKYINKVSINYAEYYTFIIDICLALIVILLPLMHYYNFGKKYEKKIIIICYINGVIGFILTFYNIYNIDFIKKGHDNNNYIYTSFIHLNNDIYSCQLDNDIFLTIEQKNENKDTFLYANNNDKNDDIKLLIEPKRELNKNNDIDFFFVIYNKLNYRWLLRYILISINIFLALLGYLLYKNKNILKNKITKIFNNLKGIKL